MDFPERFITQEDKEKIKLAVKLHTPIEITSFTLPREMELYIQEVLAVFLTECHQEHMIDNLQFCLGELLTNSKKANTKRIYFAEHNLDINDEMDYHQGMVTFKEDMLNDLRHYLEAQKDACLYIKLILKLNDDGIKIEIRNNSVLTVFERRRIKQKLKAAQKYNDPQEVIAKVIDQTEGAGLGIIIIILMLQKIGLSRENYQVFTTETETVTQILLPLNQQISETLDTLYDEFVDSIDRIPVFEESIEEFQQLSLVQKVSDDELIEFINRDVTMASVILKESSLHGYSYTKTTQAFERFGRDVVTELLSKNNLGIRPISRQMDKRNFLTHEREVAFTAYNLANHFYPGRLDLEEVYMCALFHDIECLLLDVATDEQMALVEEKAKGLEEGERMLTLFKKDFGHSRGCYKIAEKWELPDAIAQVIKYHNNPDAAPERYRKMIYVVYLADVIQYYIKGDIEFYQINDIVLEEFEIDSEKKLKFIVGKIQEAMIS